VKNIAPASISLTSLFELTVVLLSIIDILKSQILNKQAKAIKLESYITLAY
jgi:hypothetical protein